MRKRELCYICKEQSRREKFVDGQLVGGIGAPSAINPSKFFFITTVDYVENDPLFDANNLPEYTDFKNAVSCCNEHVEDLKRIFSSEEIREVSYEEWIVSSVMTA